MAGKKVKNEVEAIRHELQNLSEAVWALREHVTIQSAAAAAASSSGKSPKAKPPHDSAAGLILAPDTRGTIVTRGIVRDVAGAREYQWELETTVDELLTIDDDHAARLLAAVGHRQRLAILKMIFDKPTTAAELVSALDLGTTGAAYHHLNVLQAADLVTQEGRGVFVVQPHRVSTLLAILAGIGSAASMAVVETAANDGDPGDSTGKRKKKAA